MENFVIGMALFLLLVLGFYGMRGITRKLAIAKMTKARLKRIGPPPLGPDPGGPRRLPRGPLTGKTESAESELDPMIIDRYEPVEAKRSPPPPPGVK